MRFSILVPVYNVARYLPSCLDSLLNQTFQDFEIICINDGSTDTSGDICDEYRLANPGKITVVHKANEGLVSARRVSIQQARGEYLCFVDSDDLVVPSYLEKLNAAIQTNHADMVIFGFNRIDENGVVIDQYLPPLEEKVHSTNEELFSIRRVVMVSNDLNSLCFKCARSTLFDRDVDYTRFYQVKNTEDLLQSLPLFDCARIITVIHEHLYCYRVNMQSMTREKMNVIKLESMLLVYEVLEEYTTRWGISETEYQQRFSLIIKSVMQNLILNRFGAGRHTKEERLTLIDRVLEEDVQRKILFTAPKKYSKPWFVGKLLLTQSRFMVSAGVTMIALITPRK